MDSTSPAISRGSIIKVPDATPGLLFANGQQKPFTVEGVWKSPVAPAVNQMVDVEMDGAGVIHAITVVDQRQRQKEMVNQISGVAQERGKEAAKMAQQGVGALAAKMGMFALGSAVVVVIAMFFLPAASLGESLGALGGGGVGVSFTFWNLLGTSWSNPQLLLGGAGSSMGFLSLLGLIAVAAPFAAPFLKFPWARYLNAAPLAIVVLGFLATWMGERGAFSQLEQLGAPNPFSWSWGFYILALAALVLASQAMKAPSKA